jgi:nucleotide-binding universal stress UspA family protein
MKILLAVDGSEHARAAVDEVARRPWPVQSIIRIISVIHPYTPLPPEFVVAGEALDRMRQRLKAGAEDATSRAAEVLKQSRLASEVVIREGDPRSVIVDEAETWGADLIVLGAHGHTGFTRWLLGSVAGAIVGHAPCSVEIVRRKPAAGQPQEE